MCLLYVTGISSELHRMALGWIGFSAVMLVTVDFWRSFRLWYITHGEMTISQHINSICTSNICSFTSWFLITVSGLQWEQTDTFWSLPLFDYILYLYIARILFCISSGMVFHWLNRLQYVLARMADTCIQNSASHSPVHICFKCHTEGTATSPVVQEIFSYSYSNWQILWCCRIGKVECIWPSHENTMSVFNAGFRPCT